MTMNSGQSSSRYGVDTIQRKCGSTETYGCIEESSIYILYEV